MKASGINYIIDAGPLVGLLSERDQWHDWSVKTLTVIQERLATGMRRDEVEIVRDLSMNRWIKAVVIELEVATPAVKVFRIVIQRGA